MQNQGVCLHPADGAGDAAAVGELALYELVLTGAKPADLLAHRKFTGGERMLEGLPEDGAHSGALAVGRSVRRKVGARQSGKLMACGNFCGKRESGSFQDFALRVG
jgi:hypothetical protein